MSRKSGLQRQVLALYRRCVPAPAPLAPSHSAARSSTSPLPHLKPLTLRSGSALRVPRTKAPQEQPNFRLVIRHTFRTQALAVSPNQIASVEHLLRKAKKTVEMYEAPTVRHVSVSRPMREWESHAGLAWRKYAHSTTT